MRETIAQKKLKPTPIDFEAFKVPRRDEMPLSDLDVILAAVKSPDAAKVLAQLQSAYEIAIMNIEEAYTAFQINTPQFNND
ncbi:MAG: hypothetical protein JKY51_00045 [Opitutaceae bacterium]|nr:hypothetical protein [Opitutaceae bacterium]MBL4893325.1 hypothetical protein [Emcibacter sp.]